MALSPRIRTSILLEHKALVGVEELEETIEQELNSLGFEQAVFIILDSRQNYVYEYSIGFTEHQLHTYSSNQKHDVYLSRYMADNAFCQFVYLQDLVPDRDISDEIFWDVLLPTMKIRHSMCGIHPLLNNYMLVLSSHCFSKPTVKQQLGVNNLWQYLVHWGNGVISRLEMNRRKSRFNCSSVRADSEISVTPSEFHVLNLLVQGLDGSEIATRRRVSKETVRTQIKQLLHKTGSRHQNQLISRYYSNEIIVRR